MSTNDVLDAFGTLRRELALHSGEVLKDLEFGKTQMHILYRLSLGVATMSDLAEYTLSDKAVITRSISELEANGWLKRKTASDDKRKILVELTAKGRIRSEKAVKARDALGRRMAGTLDAGEQAKLKALLDKVTDKLVQMRKSGS